MTRRRPISREGYNKLREKLERMKTVEMERLERALGEARGHGDISDSGDFEAARGEIRLLERRIGELEQWLAQAQVIDPCQRSLDSAAFGARVTVKNINTREVEVFRLVGEGETTLHEDAASVASPLGQALLGRRAGDRLEVKVPAGLIRYEVLEISYDEG
ncbi:MAG: GreA/GreB family elongation factor [bacterium]